MFILFEGSDFSFTLPEIQARCRRYYPTQSTTVEHMEARLVEYKIMEKFNTEHLAEALKSMDVVIPGWRERSELDMRRRSDFQDDWKRSLLRDLGIDDNQMKHDGKVTERLIRLVESPPGAGKSHLMEFTVKSRAEALHVSAQMLDGSSDTLVTLALDEALSRRVPPKGQCLLTVDEYHMLTGANEWSVLPFADPDGR